MDIEEMTNIIRELGAMQKSEELHALIEYLKTKKIKTIVEIGVSTAGTTSILKREFPDAIVVGVDAGTNDNIEQNSTKYGFEFVHGDSHNPETLEKVLSLLPDRKIDFLFIDGGHEYHNVKRDYEMWGKYANIIGFHDILYNATNSNDEVYLFWNRIKKGRKVFEFTQQTGWGGIGVIEQSSTACVTHFDGDPLITQFWLMMYEKYWRGEVDKLYVDVCFHKDLVDDNIRNAQKQMFQAFPEIEVQYIEGHRIPELANNDLVPQVQEDYVFLTETDNLVFGRGQIKKYFNLLKRYDIIASPTQIIPEGLGMSRDGYMRSFMFVRNSLLKKIEIWFPPITKNGLDYDTFGWISYQLIQLNPHYLRLPDKSLSPDKLFNKRLFKKTKWVHLRQMNSSLLGFGIGVIYKGFRDKDERIMQMCVAELQDSEHAIYTYMKGIAFRLLMLDVLLPPKELEVFYKQYRELLLFMVEYLKLPEEQITAIVTYYKHLFHI